MGDGLERRFVSDVASTLRSGPTLGFAIRNLRGEQGMLVPVDHFVAMLTLWVNHDKEQ